MSHPTQKDEYFQSLQSKPVIEQLKLLPSDDLEKQQVQESPLSCGAKSLVEYTDAIILIVVVAAICIIVYTVIN